jgi:hypothetical protein
VGGPAHRPARWNVCYCHLNASYSNPNGYHGCIDRNTYAHEYDLCGYGNTHAHRDDLWRHGYSYANEYHSSFELVSKR